MVRKPIDGRVTLRVRVPHGREDFWRIMRERKNFSLADLYGASHAPRDSIRAYVHSLVLAGFLKVEAEPSGSDPRMYKLLRDQPSAPRVRRDGSIAVDQGLGRDCLWRTMKMLGDFNYRELAIQASTSEIKVQPSAVKIYVGHLHRAGYLALVSPAHSGAGEWARIARYRLLPSMNTGPLAPQIRQTKWVWDQNRRRPMGEGTVEEESADE
ncbi:hypothetical protein [Rhodospirillum sp. A1_3_36]|uniref:hypothetical protein n=1 Tax=Rhodospirillum sp. A1_3_36 TaxID=3391666 RepID=UPI0039A784E1